MSNTGKHERDRTGLVDAAIVASDHLTKQEVPHCLVGRLGLATHGYAEDRDLKNLILVEDVEILVDASQAFASGGHGLCVTKAALPLSVHDIKIKWCSFDDPWEEKLWGDELALPEKEGSIPIAPLAAILCIMMTQGDEAAVTAAIKNGASATAAQAILAEHSPRLGARLAAMMEAARR